MARPLMIVLLLSVFLQGCSVWDVINPFSSKTSIDAEVVVGDKQEDINTEISGEKKVTHNTADVVNNTYQEINEQYPFWVLVLLVLGWVLPTPSKMWKNLTSLFKRRLR